MRRGTISVVIPLYNKAAYVGSAITSALNQTDSNIEIIVVDDGSTDASGEQVFSIKDERVIYLHQENAGVSVARNTGIRHARGEYVAFLDADDLWRPRHLEMLRILTTRFPAAMLLANDFLEVAATQPLPVIKDDVPQFKQLPDYFAAVVSGEVAVFTSSAMARRDAVLEVGGFPPAHNHGEDLALWIKLARRYPVAVCSYVGSYYRRDAAGLASMSLDEPDIAMQMLLDVETADKSAENQFELHNKLALAHALQCLRNGKLQAADRFIDMARRTRLFRGRRMQLLTLRLLPQAWRSQFLDAWVGRRQKQGGLQ